MIVQAILSEKVFQTLQKKKSIRKKKKKKKQILMKITVQIQIPNLTIIQKRIKEVKQKLKNIWKERKRN